MKLLAVAALGVGIAAAEAPAVEVTMPGRFYSPAELNALVGTKVTFRNTDEVSHTVTADNDSFDSGFMPPGATFAQTFAAAGALNFHCRIHRFMRGTLRVYAVVLTGPDRPLLAGRRAHLSGIAPEGAAEVVLEQLQQGRWSDIARRAPAEDGTYSFSSIAREPAAFRARTGTSLSPVVRVQVAPSVAVHVERGRLAVLTKPARPRARVHLQVYERERFAFVSVARSRLDALGRASLALSGVRGLHVRARVLPSDGWGPAVSRPVRLAEPKTAS